MPHTLDNKSMEIAIAIATILYILLNLTYIYYYVIFCRREFLQRYVNKKYIIGLFIGLLSPIAFLIAAYVVGYTSYDADNTVIALITLIFIFLVGSGLVIYFGLQYLAIGIDTKEISFLGERVVIGNITEIEKNTKTKRLVIKYNIGTRSKKKWRFMLSSPAAKFIIDNINLLDQQNVLEK